MTPLPTQSVQLSTQAGPGRLSNELSPRAGGYPAETRKSLACCAALSGTVAWRLAQAPGPYAQCIGSGFNLNIRVSPHTLPGDP
jgi:hypothetical protein